MVPPAIPARAVYRIVAGTVACDHYVSGTQGSCAPIIEFFETDYARLHQLHMFNGLAVQH